MMGLDDRMLSHPKWKRAVALAGSEVVHLWLGLKAYCSQQLTNGHIPTDMVKHVDGPLRDRARTNSLAALQAVGLAHDAKGREACPKCQSAPPQESGIWLHDYLQHSESRDRALQRREHNRARQQKLRSTSQRDNTCDSSVTTRHQAKPIPIQSKPDLPPTPLDGGIAAADLFVNRQEISCPKDLGLAPDQVGMLETSGITREFIASATKAFVGAELADTSKRMTLVRWRKCLSKAVCSAWSQRKPPGLVRHEQTRQEAREGAQAPRYKTFRPADDSPALPPTEASQAVAEALRAMGGKR